MTTTNLAAALIAGVPRWTKINGQELVGPPLLDEHSVLAALTAALDGADERAGEFTAWRAHRDEPDDLDRAADLITALLAQNAALRAERDSAIRGRDSWRDDYKALSAAIVGDTGLSAMTVATQARLFRPRAEAAEAKVEKLRGAAIDLLAAAIPFTLPDETDGSIAEFAAEHPEEGGYCLAIRKAVAATRAALTTEADPAAAFNKADWFWRTMDPDDCGDTPEEAINRAMIGRFCVCEIASSYSGPTRYGFIAPVLDPESDDEEFVHFATQQEAIDAAKIRAAITKEKSND